MVDKVNGAAAAGEFLGRNLDFYIVSADADVDTKLEVIVETIALNGQPVIMAAPSSTTLKFVTEHTGAWVAADLEAALEAPGIGLANVSVTINAGLS